MTGTKAVCEDCGSDAVNHRLVYLSTVMSELEAWIPLARTPSPFAEIERRLSPALFNLLTLVRLATRHNASDDKTLLLARVLWDEAARRGIEMWELRPFGVAKNLFMARMPNGRSIAFEGIPFPKGAKGVPWLDDKAEMKRRFIEHGFPVAKGGGARTEHDALSIFKSLEAPVIVKPHSGSASRHTTLHIKDGAELVKAFKSARRLSPEAVIEEELVGPVYRATLVEGKLIGALRRDQPHVIGDGSRTISALMEEANRHPARQGPWFSHLKLTDAAHAELMWQGLTPESVPDAGRRVTLHQKVNWGLGGTTTDVTDQTHPDNAQLFVDIARETHAPIVGIDFIIADIARSWKDTPRSGVIELNSMPYFDNHHLPFEGEPRDVAGAIWDMIERDSKN